MSESSRSDGDSFSWAARTLDLDDRNGAPEPASLLRFVTRSDYVLSLEQADAVQIVFDRGSELGFIADLERERRGLAAIAQFAKEYFQLAPAQRSATWDQLQQDYSDLARLDEWLRHLGRALPIETFPVAEDRPFTQLVDACCQVYLSREPVRTRKRQQLLAQCSAEQFALESAINRLVEDHPEFTAAIAPWLADARQRFRFVRVVVPTVASGIVQASANEICISPQIPYPNSRAEMLQQSLGRMAGSSRPMKITKLEQWAESVHRMFVRTLLVLAMVPILILTLTAFFPYSPPSPVNRITRPSMGSNFSIFDFTRVPVSALDNMEREIPGLRAAIADPDQRAKLESLIGRLSDPYQAVRIRFGPFGADQTALEIPADSPTWVQEVKLFLMFGSSSSTVMQSRSAERPASALAAENRWEVP